MLRRFLTFIVAITTIVVVYGEKPTFDELSVKASRFIQFKEWSSAQAMLQLMVAERPADPALTGKAIAIAGVRADSVEQLRLFRNAVTNRQPFEKVFAAVENETFALARSDVYEDFLLMVAREEPWVSRSIDSYLLRYYNYRCDGPGLVKYADKMLSGMPDNVVFLHDKARGFMLMGDFGSAMATYRRIVEIAPDNVDALLALGFYAESQGDPATALRYLEQADTHMSTPYLRKQIENLKLKI